MSEINESANTSLCSHCGGSFDEEDIRYFCGEMLCPDCLDELTVVCERCGDRIWAEDAADSDLTFCQHCYDNYYTTCESCGCTIDYDDAYYFDDDTDYPYCRHCYNQRSSNEYIHDYGFKPEPIFYGKGNRYFGDELEIDEGGHIDANAEKICEVANTDERHIYIKHDGSLIWAYRLQQYFHS